MGVYHIAVIKGDGIGPEIVDEELKVLGRIAEKYGHSFNYTRVLMGGEAIEATGVPLPDETVRVCRESDAVLLGSVGDPKYDALPGDLRPEHGLLTLRKELGLYANLRPATIHKALLDASPIRSDIIGEGLDLLVVRELTGGIYFGERGYREGRYGPEAYDTEAYSEMEIRRIAHTAFRAAMTRSRRVSSVDKANVLESSKFWRKIVTEVASEYPEVTLEHYYVDNAAMQLVRNPGHFDVILTSNMFGDILSDEASQITGSIGMLPSASLSDGSFGLYEPIHGSAPKYAGMRRANPIATILSGAMMLRYSLGLKEEATRIEEAVDSVLAEGIRTADIAVEGSKVATTDEMGDAIASKI